MAVFAERNISAPVIVMTTVESGQVTECQIELPNGRLISAEVGCIQVKNGQNISFDDGVLVNTESYEIVNKPLILIRDNEKGLKLCVCKKPRELH